LGGHFDRRFGGRFGRYFSSVNWIDSGVLVVGNRCYVKVFPALCFQTAAANYDYLPPKFLVLSAYVMTGLSLPGQ